MRPHSAEGRLGAESTSGTRKRRGAGRMDGVYLEAVEQASDGTSSRRDLRRLQNKVAQIVADIYHLTPFPSSNVETVGSERPSDGNSSAVPVPPDNVIRTAASLAARHDILEFRGRVLDTPARLSLCGIPGNVEMDGPRHGCSASRLGSECRLEYRAWVGRFLLFHAGSLHPCPDTFSLGV